MRDVNSSQISVIIPIYKAEEYLSRCIDSILAQSFINFELVLVDDGSPDRSGAICDEYMLRDERIKVVHQKNGGVTAARSVGVNVSTGEYITFVDADDSLPHNALALFYAAAENGLYDIVIGKYDINSHFRGNILTVCEYQRNCIFGDVVPQAPWAKLFKRSLFTEEIFNIPRKITKGEDMLMNIRLAFQNKKPVRLLDEVVYNYVPLPSGCMSNFWESQDYEANYHSCLLASIPFGKQKYFVQEMIETRLNGLKIMSLQCPEEVIRRTAYKQQLLDDIKNLKRPLQYLDKLVLYGQSCFSFKLYFFITRVKNKLCRLFQL
ncbi:glycosyltransferase family 2 protein [Bacteroides ovatus]|jgi:glycosyltransferase involved in cell wall biosynthesis|uniref:Glycosyl transferase family 2 n=1 Tax=Bacteroides ovatus TaxID=28116 RepID=A0A1G8QS26_BACOV|nr:glycosyltransferase family 2 protein [Bacteroides ovatus]SDJ06970.1 Glycosyl transferase family 2 [Bacteroides ovatus]